MLDELVRMSVKGWTYVVGSIQSANGKPYIVRIESPDGQVVTKGPFVTDNEARVVMAEARTRVEKGALP